MLHAHAAAQPARSTPAVCAVGCVSGNIVYIHRNLNRDDTDRPAPQCARGIPPGIASLTAHASHKDPPGPHKQLLTCMHVQVQCRVRLGERGAVAVGHLPPCRVCAVYGYGATRPVILFE